MKVRWLVLVGVVAGLLVGCGGKTAGDGGPGGSTGGATSGSGGTGGVDGAACTAPQQSGSCEAYVEAWWHDPGLGLCVPFVYGGCEGNANRHDSLEACLEQCPSRGASVDACETNDECVLREVGCCGACEPVAARDFVALNAERVAEYEAARECGPILCGACEDVPVVGRTRQNFYAACAEGQCTVRDVRDGAISECFTVADCRLRCGSGCCEGCGAGEDLIAVSTDADSTEEFCGGLLVPCPACDCVFPETASVDCVAGQCVVKYEPACSVSDLECNDDPTMSSIAGECELATGTCICLPGRTKNPTTGRCY